MGQIKSINLTTPICNTSYGLVGQNLLKALINKGIEVSLRPIGPLDPDVAAGYDKYINQCNPNFFAKSPHIIIWHQFDLKKFLQPNVLNVGFPIFELDSFDARERENLNACEALVTCSQWGCDILKKFAPNKLIGKVPLGIDPDIIFSFQNEPHDKVRFVQLSKWEVRKGQFHTIRAFSEVFADIDDVELSLVCHNDFIGQEENDKWNNLAKKLCGDKVNIISERFQSHLGINLFLNDQDVGVFPSLAEGWNLSALELISLGKLVIATNYSGHTEFLNEDNAYLIDIDEMELAFDFRWFFGQGNWAKFGESEFEQLKIFMMAAYNYIKNQRKLGLTTQPESGKLYTWEKSAEALISFLQGI